MKTQKKMEKTMEDNVKIVFEMPRKIAVGILNQVWANDNEFRVELKDNEIEKVAKMIKNGKEVNLKYG